MNQDDIIRYVEGLKLGFAYLVEGLMIGSNVNALYKLRKILEDFSATELNRLNIQEEMM
jgi:hypothetical protein